MPVGTALTRLTDGIPQTAAPEPGQAPASPSGRDGRDHPATAVTTAVLLATAPAGDAPAATLPWGEGTIVDRLLDQLGELGVQSIVMITRPHWEGALGQVLDGRELVEPPLDPAWEEELRGKARAWRLELWRLARGAVDEPAADATDEAVDLSAEDEGELERWLATAPDDAVSLALVGLVRSGVHVG